MLVCQYCHDTYDPDDDFDRSHEGFWCDTCDGFTYFSGRKNHRFTVIVEEPGGEPTKLPKTPVRLRKQLSPLRYPGGKSKLIPLIFHKLQDGRHSNFVSPYTGGGSVELSLLDAGVVERLILNDKDIGIYAMFWIIKNMPDALIDRIRHCRPTRRQFYKAQSVVRSDFAGCTLIEAAWSTLLLNRLAYSGIYKANPLGGRYGSRKKLIGRWNPNNLIKRIERIHQMSDRYEIHNIDACEMIKEEYWRSETTIFIDPPYVHQGKALYRHYYEMDDHIQLQTLLDSLHQGMPGADLILTYDQSPLIERFKFPTSIEKISRQYSI